MRAEWKKWNGEEDKPQDHESLEEIFHDPAEQSTLLVPSVDQRVNQSNLQERSLDHRSLIDLSPLQPQKEVPTLLPALGGGVEVNQRSRSDGFPKTVALKGTIDVFMFRIRLAFALAELLLFMICSPHSLWRMDLLSLIDLWILTTRPP